MSDISDNISDIMSNKIGEDCSIIVASYLDCKDCWRIECNNETVWKTLVHRDFDRCKYFWTDSMPKRLGWQGLYKLLNTYSNNAWFAYTASLS